MLATLLNYYHATLSLHDKPKVLQLETAMGAAIECFKGAGAVAVPRTRFAPVKKCNDLMLLRSDAYVVNEHFNIVLAPERSVPSPDAIV